MRKVYAIVFMLQVACNHSPEALVNSMPIAVKIPSTIVLVNDSLLRVRNGVCYYKQQPFSGTVQANYPNGNIQYQEQFYNGLQHGISKTFFEDGSKQSLRFYSNGEKDSVHTGWWNNGTLRFQYHFNKGIYNGSFKEFYQSGKPLKEIEYYNGNDSYGKAWRENGKPFMNYVMKEGRRYGLMNAQPCYELKNEKGQYLK